jgi:transglutaminase-like putative cysteine protease
MTAAQYRQLLGALMAWSVVPLPFLYIILPPFWLVTGAVGLLLAVRPTVKIRMSTAVLNTLGVAIIVVVLAVGGLRVGPLRPLGHLLLLLTAVRALAVTDRRSFLSGLLPVFLVWVVSVTSSTHITIIAYFMVSAGVWWWAGMKILLAGTEVDPRRSGVSLPRPRHAIVASLAALVVAGPIFVVMPRLRVPWVAGRGGMSAVTGFTSQVELGGVGTIRTSPEVAMIVRSAPGTALDSRWMRLRGTALERVTLDSWAPRGASLVPERGGLVWPFGRHRSLDGTVELQIELVNPRRYLFLPEGTVAVSAPVGVLLDPSGGVVLESRPRGPLTYSVWVARHDGPRPSDLQPSSLRTFDLDPEVRRLALEMIAGRQSPRAIAEAVESYLQENYAYSLSGMTHMRSDPVAWFLLTEKAGHCEYFAGAMVAILADLGIPARIVAGYSGGSLAADGESAVVREANAHTWVEAQVGRGSEWSTFDPTPAGEVPALNRATRRERIQWALQWMESSWDRYVLTFGFGEQAQVLSALTSIVESVARSLSWWMLGAAAVVAAGIGLVRRRWRRHRPRVRRARGAGTPAAAVMGRVAGRLARAGIEVPPRATVRWIANRARARWPAIGAAIGDLTWLAERELYAGISPQPADRAAVRKLWAQARRAMKQTS